MKVCLRDAGKKFNRDWIFRGVNQTFEAGQSYVITGPNGSGKSTLLQVMAGLVPATAGTIEYYSGNLRYSPEEIYRQLVIASPYQELIEEFSLTELIRFHFSFKPLPNKITTDEFMDIIQLTHARHKPVKFFSSGMKTRLKLGLAFLSEVPLVLLDEPASNLDTNGIRWYQRMLHTYGDGRTLLICSNQGYEYEGLTNILRIENANLTVNLPNHS